MRTNAYKHYKPTLKAIHTRERLLEKAELIFAKKGFHRCRIDEIVEASGLAKGTFYQYFKSKDEILKSCLDQLKLRIDQFLATQIQDFVKSHPNATSQDFRKYLRQSVEGFLQLYVEKRHLFQILFGTRLENKVSDNQARAILDSCTRSYDGMIQNAKNAGFVKSIVPSHYLALFCLSTVFQSGDILFNQEGRTLNTDLVEHFVTFVCEGCRI